LHLHHIVRFRTDAAWPAPVWGLHEARAYEPTALDEIRTLFGTAALPGFESFVDA
jgi:diadenosine tetraphosphate (Ap4A) HIT family hydrolase